eukprot:Hpha_TRINITY_DN15119_c3_g1::TRINITY_DN15119_c3_g1_i1::g.126763::m.126763
MESGEGRWVIRLERCFARWSAWIMRESDTPKDGHIKRTLTPPVMLLLFFALIMLVVALTARDQNVLLWIAGTGVIITGFIQFLVSGCLAMNMSTSVDVLIVLCTLGVLGVDMVHASNSFTRHIGLIILLLDTALVLNTPRSLPLVFFLTTLYVLIERTEAGLRFGLYDVFYRPHLDACECAEPPCALGPTLILPSFVNHVVVIYIDFHLTRRFATDLRIQLRRMKVSVETAAEVAAALARYDVDSAEMVIGPDLPEELAKSFRQLLSILRSYRAYLPHSCLVDDAPEVDNTPEADTQESDKSSMDVEDLHTDSQSSLESRENIPPGVQPEQWKAVKRSTRDRTSYEGRGRRADSLGSTPFKRKVKNNRSKALAVKPRRARVSLAAGNMLGYLNQERSLMGAHNTKWIESDVECWCAAVISSRGVVDLIGGDRRYASFNARKQCVGHASAAIGVLISRGAVECTGCVVSGQVVCGTYGCSTAMRFMVLGGVASSLHPFERIAARWKLRVLTDQVAYNLARFQWRGKLLAALFLTKRTECAINVYTITDRKDGSNSPGQDLVVLENEDEPENKPAAEAIAARLAKVDAESARQTSQKDPLGDWVLRVREVGLDIL